MPSRKNLTNLCTLKDQCTCLFWNLLKKGSFPKVARGFCLAVDSHYFFDFVCSPTCRKGDSWNNLYGTPKISKVHVLPENILVSCSPQNLSARCLFGHKELTPEQQSTRFLVGVLCQNKHCTEFDCAHASRCSSHSLISIPLSHALPSVASQQSQLNQNVLQLWPPSSLSWSPSEHARLHANNCRCHKDLIVFNATRNADQLYCFA